jgi:myo-inositol-1-phosphate synthase
MVWCGSTETYIKPGPQHQTIEAFEKAMEENDDDIAPSMLYAYAAIMEGVAYCNGAPNLSADFPALSSSPTSAACPSRARTSRPARRG